MRLKAEDKDDIKKIKLTKTEEEERSLQDSLARTQ